MKIEIHKADERGKADYGWLKTRYSFSFADYYNPERMGFGALRVLNDDVIAAGKGFGDHHHADMEIVTIVLSGALEHRDSMGNRGTIGKDEVQRMSAGTGVVHSEFNASEKEEVRLFQVWIDTAKKGIEPGYEQKKIEKERNKLVKLVSNNDGSALSIGQDSEFLLGSIEKGKEIVHKTKKERGIYVLVVKGSVRIEDKTLKERDAAAITDADIVNITALSTSEILVIEVPMT